MRRHPGLAGLKPAPSAATGIPKEGGRAYRVRLPPFNLMSNGFGNISDTIPPL
jgi:hypothetical protein